MQGRQQLGQAWLAFHRYESRRRYACLSQERGAASRAQMDLFCHMLRRSVHFRLLRQSLNLVEAA